MFPLSFMMGMTITHNDTLLTIRRRSLAPLKLVQISISKLLISGSSDKDIEEAIQLSIQGLMSVRSVLGDSNQPMLNTITYQLHHHKYDTVCYSHKRCRVDESSWWHTTTLCPSEYI
ncbi:unnamed protein product [Nezara viridula]|uniref:Uncharacterized protein n=1 Tax=Nezara viridula TaxID=85310 RepID=A0A9P0H501_NEZVI|nr:unnamed protein product [Nezara viridula]